MRQQEVFNKIGNIINELAEQYDYLKTQPAPLDDLELELFTANANFLTDHLEVLRKLNTALEKGNQARVTVHDPESTDDIERDPVAEPTTLSDLAAIEEHLNAELPKEESHEVVPFEFDLTPAKSDRETTTDDLAYFERPEPEVNEAPLNEHAELSESDPHQIDLTPNTGDDHYSFIRSTEHEATHNEFELSEAGTFTEEMPKHSIETVADALAEIELAAVEKAAVVGDEPQNAPAQNNNITKPEFENRTDDERPLTLNERMAQNTANQQPKELQITDLKAAINLNDKMLFVRDLFNGYSLAYSEAIEILNRFSKLEDAERFLSVNYESKNNWADKPGTKEKFYDLLKRRFA